MNKYYSDITELPLRNYIDVVVSDPINLNALTIEGFPTEEELQSAWREIQGQYSDLMGDMEGKIYIKLLKEVTLLAADYKLVHLYVSLLRNIYVEQAGKEINKILKSSFKFNHQDKESYERDLQRALNQSKALKIKLDITNIEFEAIRKKHETQAIKPTKAYFQSILITLTDHAKVPITDNISVYEFCERLRRFNQYVDQQTKQFKENNGR